MCLFQRKFKYINFKMRLHSTSFQTLPGRCITLNRRRLPPTHLTYICFLYNHKILATQIWNFFKNYLSFSSTHTRQSWHKILSLDDATFRMQICLLPSSSRPDSKGFPPREGVITDVDNSTRLTFECYWRLNIDHERR